MFAVILQLLSAFLAVWPVSVSSADQQFQPDCSALKINSGINVAVSGESLAVCSTTELQCCTPAFIASWQQTLSQELQDSIKHELVRYSDTLGRMVGILEQHMSVFIKALILEFPAMNLIEFATQENVTAPFVTKFIDGLFINTTVPTEEKFNETEFIHSVLSLSLDMFTETFTDEYVIGTATKEQRKCIRDTFESKVKTSNLFQASNNLAQVRKVLTFMSLVRSWYRDNLTSLAGFRPGSSCTNGFVGLKCEACKIDVPSLCQSICGNLAKGCLSPFHDGLRNQMEILWNVTRQVVGVGDSELHDAASNVRGLSPISFSHLPSVFHLVSSIGQDCAVSVIPPFGGRRRRRQLSAGADPFSLPSSVTHAANQLTGTFKYEVRGPVFCLDHPVTECWDGQEVRAEDPGQITVSESIASQAFNPVIPFEVKELVQQAYDLGTPVSSALSSFPFTSVLPKGVLVPVGMRFSLEGQAINFTNPLITEQLPPSSQPSTETPSNETPTGEPPPDKAPTDEAPSNESPSMAGLNEIGFSSSLGVHDFCLLVFLLSSTLSCLFATHLPC